MRAEKRRGGEEKKEKGRKREERRGESVCKGPGACAQECEGKNPC